MSLAKNFLIDLVAFIGLLLAMEPRFTGIELHEWGSLAFAGLLIVHLLIHWTWVTGVLTRFVKRFNSLSRFRLVLDIAIFVGFTLVMFSGIMISESILALFGLGRESGEELRRNFSALNSPGAAMGMPMAPPRGEGLAGGMGWRQLHDVSANITLLLVAVHVALHWEWVKKCCYRLVILPLKNEPATNPAAAACNREEQN